MSVPKNNANVVKSIQLSKKITLLYEVTKRV